MNIGVVHGRATVRSALRRLIQSDRRHTLSWSMGSGEEAVRRCRAHPVDLVLMEIHLPDCDGVEVLRQIVALKSAAVLVVTEAMKGSGGQVFKALSAGAVDVILTPSESGPDAASEQQQLLSKLEEIERLHRSVVVAPSARQRSGAVFKRRGLPLVAIGASAGGPRALAAVLEGLPPDLPAGVIIAQHLDEEFSEGLARWLDSRTALSVRVAVNHDRVVAGEVLLAPGGRHVRWRSGGRLQLDVEPADLPFSPCIDLLFRSLARRAGPVVGVLLTGIGSDGAEGLLALKMGGHLTLVQSPETAAVYGMPSAAVKLGAATETLELEDIPQRIARFVQG